MSASIKHYILKSKKDIHLIRKQLNRLETELIEYRLSETQRKTTEQHSVDLPASCPVEPTVASEALAALASAAKNNPALLNAVGQDVQSAIISYWISQGELEAGELA
ncbi:hypothetical protein [Ectobacillus ponti]|uniref:Uncharacterized protein n=1 Tax=Ectobacillus ponti TaxID=2961894 RepID=A0AA41XDC1_9BACI|nr:hypothetical protein [Ectobacillus ponti]MCP8970800.1 hypothetical protein [Ectobacillus ponti]